MVYFVALHLSRRRAIPVSLIFRHFRDLKRGGVSQATKIMSYSVLVDLWSLVISFGISLFIKRLRSVFQSNVVLRAIKDGYQ